MLQLTVGCLAGGPGLAGEIRSVPAHPVTSGATASFDGDGNLPGPVVARLDDQGGVDTDGVCTDTTGNVTEFVTGPLDRSSGRTGALLTNTWDHVA